MYVEKMEMIFKTIIKNYSIKLMQNIDEQKIYDNIFAQIEEYITDVLPYKVELEFENKKMYDSILAKAKELEKYKYESSTNRVKYIEKNALLLDISRDVFVHSLPLIAAEQCYISLIKETRNLIVKAPDFNKKDEAYKLIINLIQAYNVKLLSKKVYWDSSSTREEYNKFWKEYQRISKLENIDYDASVNDSTNNEESNLSTTIENETEDDTRALKRVTLAFNKTEKNTVCVNCYSSSS